LHFWHGQGEGWWSSGLTCPARQEILDCLVTLGLGASNDVDRSVVHGTDQSNGHGLPAQHHQIAGHTTSGGHPYRPSLTLSQEGTYGLSRGQSQRVRLLWLGVGDEEVRLLHAEDRANGNLEAASSSRSPQSDNGCEATWRPDTAAPVAVGRKETPQPRRKGIRDPAPPSQGRVVLFGPRHWAERLALPPLFIWALAGTADLAGAKPSAGGWLAVLPFMGAGTLLWVLVTACTPTQLLVGPDWVACRIIRRWMVVPAATVTEVSLQRSGSNTHLVVRGQGRRVSVNPALLKPPERRAAFSAFLANVAHVGDSNVAVISSPSPPGRGAKVWRGVVAASMVLTAVIGVLRLVQMVAGHG